MTRTRLLLPAAGLAIAIVAFILPACSARPGDHTVTDRSGAQQPDPSGAGRVEELLEGRFPGVRVFRHGDGRVSVQIRGASTIQGDAEPLYVVDGVPMEEGLLSINPNDIVRIEVLKDIGSTSFYGVRGANGVILITTRGARGR